MQIDNKAFDFYFQHIIIILVGNKVGKEIEDMKPLNFRKQEIVSEMRDEPNIITAKLHNILGVS